MGIRYVALDIDGTVFSSESIITETYREAIQEYAEMRGLTMSIPSHEKIMNEIGKPVKIIFKNLLPLLPEIERDRISNRVLSLLVEKIQEGKGYYYPGIESTIRELHSKGIYFLACSNGRIAYIEAILKYINVLILFKPIVVLDNESRKEKKDILLYYLKEYSLDPKELLMVGDRYSDWEAAKEAGCPFVFCRYGHSSPGEIPNYDYAIDSPEELKKILL